MKAPPRLMVDLRPRGTVPILRSMAASWKRSGITGDHMARMVGVSGSGASREPDPVVPPRFARHLEGAAHRRRGRETPWVAVVRVGGVDAIREEWGDPAAEEFLRSTASALRASLRESDKLSPVGRAEYGIILDAPSAEAVLTGLERLVGIVAELAGRDHRWSAGSLCVGVTPLDTPEAAVILDRARDAIKRGETDGQQVTLAAASH
jgi:GGDEF domain-containing protein